MFLHLDSDSMSPLLYDTFIRFVDTSPFLLQLALLLYSPLLTFALSLALVHARHFGVIICHPPHVTLSQLIIVILNMLSKWRLPGLAAEFAIKFSNCDLKLWPNGL